MKIKIPGIYILLLAILLGCDGRGVQLSNKKDQIVDISGTIKGGYRHISTIPSNDTLKYTVYRGDYVKFQIDDGGDSRSEYELNIPELSIKTILFDNMTDQPYFKMKNTGKYQFKLGDQMGVLDVVELRQSNYLEVSAEESWKMINKNPPFILDVRRNEEFNTGHLRGAKLIPLQELQLRLTEIEMYKNQPILIYCATGNRSTTASKILLDNDFKHVMNMRMGIMAWGSKGYNIQFN